MANAFLNTIRDGEGKLVVYEKGRVGDGYQVCNTCYGKISEGQIPKAAVINGFDLGSNSEMSGYLKNLTEVEEILIAKVSTIWKSQKAH